MKNLASQYRAELLENVVPFWTTHCPDREFGGYFTCLDRDGTVYDTEKFMWMQWRIVWMLCQLYHEVEKKQEWLDLAVAGFDFLRAHGKDERGRYYFSLNREGVPAMAPYSICSEAFAAMGCAALYRVTGNDAAKQEALSAYRQYLERRNAPKGEWEKTLAGRGQYDSIGHHMILVNVQNVMGECLADPDFFDEQKPVMDHVVSTFWDPKKEILLENVPCGGGFDMQSMTGRHYNPGHILETMWFLLLASQRHRHQAIQEKCIRIALATLEHGWDREYGGLYYFMDAAGKPHVELQWDMKLWWVHCEAILAVVAAGQITGNRAFQEWFNKLHAWTWEHFPDPKFGEWYGYLNRRGEPTHALKGGKWKTLFHLPRMLLQCSQWMEKGL